MRIEVGDSDFAASAAFLQADEWAKLGKVLFIDGGNCFSPYFFFRQNKSAPKAREALKNILVSRPFTIYQLRQLIDDAKTSLVANGASSLIVSRLTDLFADEDVELVEREAIMRHIIEKLREVGCASVLVTLNKRGVYWNEKLLEGSEI